MLRSVHLYAGKLSTTRQRFKSVQANPATSPLRRQMPTKVQLPLQLLPQIFSNSSRRTQDVFHSQLEDPSAAAIFSSLQTSSSIPQTLTEKIFQKHSLGLAQGKHVRAGDYISLSPHYLMTHDNSWPVALKFMSIGASKIHNPHQVVMTLDHDVQNKSETNLKKYRQIEEFARKHEVDFYPAGRGIGHQIMVEEGYAWPGTLVVASDSHSNMYGGVGCLGTPVVRTDAASIWATGRTWWQIPPVAKINFTGTLPVGVTGKDVIVALCGLFNNDEVLNHAIEFSGSEETLRSLPVDDRLTIANMTTEWGALTGLFPIDSVLKAWLRYKATESALYRYSELSDKTTYQRINHPRLKSLFSNPLSADKGAKYAKEYFLDLSTLSPHVSGPNSVKVATPLEELSLQHVRIDKAYLVSCTNSRASDLAAAANVFREAAEKQGGVVPKIAKGVTFYIAAASLPEEQAAQAAGDWQIMLEAGAKPLPSGCGPCIGLGTGLLEPGEVGISASNRNFKGRMGSTEAKAYLASPEVVAASALNGRITGPGWYNRPEGWSGVILGETDGAKQEDRLVTTEGTLETVLNQMEKMIEKGDSDFQDNSESLLTEISPGFAEKITGEIVFCDADNINTDGIYPGKFTYQDDVSVEQMAEVCMSNYDTAFSSVAQAGDILVTGFNFGCGSSREQAATSILAKQIPLVVAGSFGNTFSRNSINNALMGVELPHLVQRLRETFTEPKVQESQQGITEPLRSSDSLNSLSSQETQRGSTEPSRSTPEPQNEITKSSPSTQDFQRDVSKSSVRESQQDITEPLRSSDSLKPLSPQETQQGSTEQSRSAQEPQKEITKSSPSAQEFQRDISKLSPSAQESQQEITEPSHNSDSLDSPPPNAQIVPRNEKLLTRRTGWKLVWDVRRSKIEVQEGEGGPVWSRKVREVPPNVQEIIARGGLEKWIKKEIDAAP